MSVRKRTWTTKGVEKAAWVVDYIDATGKRRLKAFRLVVGGHHQAERKRGTHISVA